MNKKVLMIAHQFPPVGGSGVQRTTKFVKYLHRFGWEPVVLTRDSKGMTLTDESLLKDIPEKTKIFRTNPWNLLELPGILKLFGKVINRKVLIPDGERLWQFFSKGSAANIVASEGIELIYTTSYPYSSHLMGLYLKKKFPLIPWVADFRDEWTKNPNIQDYNYNFIRTSMEKNMEDSILEKADCVIANTPVMMENFLEDRPSLRDKFVVIPNGYDEEDFRDIPHSPPENDVFTVTYTGLLYGRRKPDTFLEAVSRLLHEGLLDRRLIRIDLVGHFNSEALDNLIRRFDLGGIVKVFPYMKHKESILKLMSSDALLMVAGAGEEAFYLGKIFEYMRTGRPILAVVPENGAAAELIRDTGTGLVSDSSDVDKTKHNIFELFNGWKSGESILSPSMEKISRFERCTLTEQLCKAFAKAEMSIKR
ncbi:glycosyltransferase involved in cell wall biosynthesis [Anaerobacterium chartisolvens]|uniref:Glycosyltransferase involved in cell wall biosynthesis n=1 Tax=Anaerobacterium chartisolvens TaxID=1297424 RepID=A0A369AIA3_9FIRM|nr:glycosyltransferase family 4 protein [Anaerobacterium chartisolvens]RCX09109.1 glycosyltransferase involved in cell wall biosynthesis [Anaerobacterium chartisolvens]